MKQIAILFAFLSAFVVGPAQAALPECNSTPTHCVLLSLPVHKSDLDEPAAPRRARLFDTAQAIDSATEDRRERAFLVMTGEQESHYATYVDFDEPLCRDRDKEPCDWGLAWSVWQVHGTDRKGTRADAARISLRKMQMAGNFCRSNGHDYWLGGIAHYARGREHCEWEKAEFRVNRMRTLLARMNSYEKQLRTKNEKDSGRDQKGEPHAGRP